MANLLKMVGDLLDSRPAATLLSVPDVVQQGAFDCGAAATMSVCRYFGVGPLTEEEYIRDIPSTPDEGTPPNRIVAFLKKVGLAVDERQHMTVKDLHDYWQRGMPVLCPVQNYGTVKRESRFQSGHWVVVVGCVPAGYVTVQDPTADKMFSAWHSDAAPGLVMVKEDAWDKAWIDMDASGNLFDHYGIAVRGV